VQYGHRMDDPVEIVTMRVNAVGLLPRPVLPLLAVGTGNSQQARKGARPVYHLERGEYEEYMVYDRQRFLCGDRVEGPAIIEEPSSTTDMHGEDVATVGKYGELVIEIRRL